MRPWWKLCCYSHTRFPRLCSTPRVLYNTKSLHYILEGFISSIVHLALRTPSIVRMSLSKQLVMLWSLAWESLLYEEACPCATICKVLLKRLSVLAYNPSQVILKERSRPTQLLAWIFWITFSRMLLKKLPLISRQHPLGSNASKVNVGKLSRLAGNHIASRTVSLWQEWWQVSNAVL